MPNELRAEHHAALLRELCDGWKQHDKALADYFAYWGAEHSTDHCPEDDTCDCPLLVAMRETEHQMRQAIQRANDALRKVTAYV